MVRLSLPPLCFAFLLTIFLVAPARAHKPSDSYLRIRANPSGHSHSLKIQWDIALKDLELLIGLDNDQNGEITWGEVRAKSDAIVAHALTHLKLKSEGEEHSLQFHKLLINDHSDGAYAVLDLSTKGEVDLQQLSVHYDLLFEKDSTHRGLVLFDDGETKTTLVLSPDRRSVRLLDSQTGIASTLLQYIREGVWHIWIGFDHILFLLALLLPSVYLWQNNEWIPVEEFRPACRSVLKIVTVFTVAHSITLWLAVTDYVALPSQWVETTIAASIIVTAINNLYPVLRLPAWLVAFGFGLIHGFGFANVLVDLGLSSTALAVSLLGFNIGVELGQLAIVIAYLPFAFLFRRTAFYRRVIFQLGSVVVGIIASIWVYERVASVEILGF